MAENENGEEKTETATAKKRKDAREKGNVLKSQDISVVCSLFMTFLVLRVTAPLIYTSISQFMTKYVENAGSGMEGSLGMARESFIRGLILDSGKTFLIASGIIMAVSFIIAILSNGIQTQFLISFENLKFKIDKLNPVNGIKKMFSIKGVFELAKNLLKMIILAAVVYSQISKRLTEISRLMYIEPKSGVLYIAQSAFSIVMTIGGVFVAVAVVDFMFQRYQYENDLKMTKQEVKDEYKQMEGDPKIKSKRRAIQQQMANQRMMQEVPSADVIIRNPTHFAVAVKYDPAHHSAPVIVAKGKDMVALRIVDAGAEADVPSVENKPLARALFDNVEIGAEIPAEYYQGVADVLWFVYNLKNKPIPLSGKNEPPPRRGGRGGPYNY